jgi:hypothetical protein
MSETTLLLDSIKASSTEDGLLCKKLELSYKNDLEAKRHRTTSNNTEHTQRLLVKYAKKFDVGVDTATRMIVKQFLDSYKFD